MKNKSLNTGTKLAIFNTFKTRAGELTGEANRQRSIIKRLASKVNPTERTRTGIAQGIAANEEIAWKNIYSGIFHDLDKVLLPMGIAQEDGRLPIKRGPRALQESGMPYYRLTRKGVLVALAIKEIPNKGELLEEFLSETTTKSEKKFAKILVVLSQSSPKFVWGIFEKYIKAYCEQDIVEIEPFDIARLQRVADDTIQTQIEMIKAFFEFDNQHRKEWVALLDEMCIMDTTKDTKQAREA